MKNVIITGASGFIGKALTKKLLAQGVNVTAVVRDAKKMADISCGALRVIEADFDAYRTLAEKIPAGGYDVFFHLAWDGYGKTTNDYTVQARNITAACDAVSAAAELHCGRFVFASSFSEYMIPENSPVSHADGGVCNVYGSTKESARLLAQAVALQKGISMTSVAFSNTFGPGDYSRRTPNLFIHRFQNKLPVALTPGTALYEWTFIDDSVDGLLAAAEKGKDNRLYYIGGCGIKPLKEIVEAVRDTIDSEGVIQYGVYQENFCCDYASIDAQQLNRDTGYSPRCDFAESVRKTAQWLIEINFHL